MSPTSTVWSVATSVSERVPSGLPLRMPWARLDCTMAETLEFSSVMRRTVEVEAPHSIT